MGIEQDQRRLEVLQREREGHLKKAKTARDAQDKCNVEIAKVRVRSEAHGKTAAGHEADAERVTKTITTMAAKIDKQVLDAQKAAAKKATSAR